MNRMRHNTRAQIWAALLALTLIFTLTPVLAYAQANAPTAAPDAPTAVPDTPAPSPSPSPAPTPTSAPILTTRVRLTHTTGSLNLRKSASKSAAVVSKLPVGGIATLLGYERDSSGQLWYNISYQGRTGYVSGEYVAPAPDATPSLAPSSAPTPTLQPGATPPMPTPALEATAAPTPFVPAPPSDVYWVTPAEVGPLNRGTGTTGIRPAVLHTHTGPYVYESVNLLGVVQVRVTLSSPAAVTEELLLSGAVQGEAVERVSAHFRSRFSNEPFAVIHLDQSAPWGQLVSISALVDLTGLNAQDLSQDLCLYSYDAAADTYTPLSDPLSVVDADGYLFFLSALAGEIIITGSPLMAR